MKITSATISISNLRLRTFIGFNDEEREKQQDIVINAEIQHRLDPQVVEQDQVDAALNYKTITKQIIRLVEDGRFLLLEKLTHEVLAICAEDASVIKATVRIDKPHALRFADSVSVTLSYDAAVDVAGEKEHEHTLRSISQAS
jgi:D-erythro-7,8-dihydroneopterin triphosphate epimerase